MANSSLLSIELNEYYQEEIGASLTSLQCQCGLTWDHGVWSLHFEWTKKIIKNAKSGQFWRVWVWVSSFSCFFLENTHSHSMSCVQLSWVLRPLFALRPWWLHKILTNRTPISIPFWASECFKLIWLGEFWQNSVVWWTLANQNKRRENWMP